MMHTDAENLDSSDQYSNTTGDGIGCGYNWANGTGTGNGYGDGMGDGYGTGYGYMDGMGYGMGDGYMDGSGEATEGDLCWTLIPGNRATGDDRM
jgi:hypothetical protein